MKRELIKGSVRALRTWGALLRLPNLFSAPGDPLVGGLLAGAALDLKLCTVAGIALFLYAAGLMLNDLADADLDQLERPERPLPSGRISHRAVRAALWCCLGPAWLLSLTCGAGTVLTTALLTLSIFGYNLRFKHHRILGPVSMGLCRGLSVCLSMSVAGQVSGLAVGAALLWTVFIATISALAQRECTGRPYGVSRWGPSAVLLTGLALSLVFRPAAGQALPGLGPLVLAVGLTLYGGLRINVQAPRAIGLMLRSLLPLQSAALGLAGHPLLSLAWLLLLVPQTICARYFKAS